MLILIDDREYKSHVTDWLCKEENVEIRQQRLTAGDYIINDQLIFERKTLLDFIASIKDGRLFPQMQRLVNAEKKCALLLEGTSKDLEKSHMRREAIQGALIQITLFMGVPVLRAMDAQESARLMLYAAKQAEAVDQKSFTVRRHQPYRVRSRQKRQLFLLQGLPGIGPQRARALLEKFESIEQILLASDEELSSIPGLGPYTIQSMQWILKENEGYYVDGLPEL